MRYCIIALVFVIGCHHQTADDGSTGPHLVADTGDPTDRSGNMVSMDKQDQARTELDRKNSIMPHCLAMAMENQEVPRGTHGKITLEIVIAGTKASSVKVARSDIASKTVTDCVIKHVQEIEFPDMGPHFETSYTYAMEAN